jgi:hypothetical protein
MLRKAEKDSRVKTKSSHRLLPALAGGTLLMALAFCTGCNGNTPPLSKEEKANFSGGPMPESAKKIMQQKMQEARQKMPPGATPPTGPQ